MFGKNVRNIYFFNLLYWKLWIYICDGLKKDYILFIEDCVQKEAIKMFVVS